MLICSLQAGPTQLTEDTGSSLTITFPHAKTLVLSDSPLESTAMESFELVNIDRRQFIASTASAVAAGYAVNGSSTAEAAATPTPSGADDAITALYKSLSDTQRREVCFGWDERARVVFGQSVTRDPSGVVLRQHISNTWLITPHKLGGDFYTDKQRMLVRDVLHTVFAAGWVDKIIKQAEDDVKKPWGDHQALAIFGQPDDDRLQCVITGFHLTTRATVDERSNVAFGGPIAHGHQPSGFYERVGHPGNIFWYQTVKANEIFRGLDKTQRDRALRKGPMPYYEFDGKIDRTTVTLKTPRYDRPREHDIRFQAESERPGLPIADMTSDQQAEVHDLIADLLKPYCDAYREQVKLCLAAQGGLKSCKLAFYQQHDLGDDRQWDNWRLEGPSLVWYFRGYPHVHIWIHVASDATVSLSSHFG